MSWTNTRLTPRAAAYSCASILSARRKSRTTCGCPLSSPRAASMGKTLRTSALDPQGQRDKLLARLSARKVLLESIGPCEAEVFERTARRWTPLDRWDLEIGRIRAADDLPQQLDIIDGTAEGPRLSHVHEEPARSLGKGETPISDDRLVGRLQAEHAAEMRRHPQRSSPISAQLQCRH